MRSIRGPELDLPLSTLLESLQREGDSIVIRDHGEYGIAVATLLTGKDYEEFAEWQAKRARDAADKIQAAFAAVPEDELERMVNEAIREVRHERYAARKAS